MSGKLKPVGKISDVKDIRKYLIPYLAKVSNPETDDALGWDSDWGWEDVDITNSEKDDENAGSWLENILISVSPVGDKIAFANDNRMVILSQNFDRDSTCDDDTCYYKQTYKGEPSYNEEGEIITSIQCVPLSSQRKSSHGLPDWTCVILGFSSGYVRFYEDNGGEILSQLFHNKPVKKIRMKTYEPRRHSANEEQTEELSVLYSDCLVVVEGFSLFQTLRACRNHLARAAAGGQGLTEPPPMAFKKWGLLEQNYFCDHISAGLRIPCTFDRFVTASLISGAYATLPATPPKHYVYITSGREPCVAFYYAAEGAWTPVLSDIALAVANKVKNVLFSATSLGSWFGGSNSSASKNNDTKKEDERNSPKIEPATALRLRFSLPDKRREGLSLVLSGDFRTAAVTDTFGRIILVDVMTGCAVRMWKGYREANVGFLEVEESSEQRRRVHYLVIYAPRRGILEVWVAHQGPRVAAFNVDKAGRLVDSGYKMVGLNNVSYKSVRVSSLQRLHFIDSDGSVHMFDIPFHLSLTDKNSHRTHDHLLIKQLRSLVKVHSIESDCLDEEISDIFRQFKLVGCLELALDRLLNAKYLSGDFVKKKLKEIIQLLESDSGCRQSPVVEKHRLITYAKTFLSLFDTYALLQSMSYVKVPADTVKEESEMLKVKRFADLLAWEHEDSERCLALYALCTRELSPKFGSEEHMLLLPNEISGLEYIDWFYCHLEGLVDENARMRVEFHAKIADDKRARMGRFFFETCLNECIEVDYTMTILEDSCIPVKMCVSALSAYFVSEDRCNFELTSILKDLIKKLLHLRREEELSSADLVQLFSEIRVDCHKSAALTSVFLLGMVARVVLLEESQKRQTAEAESTDILLEEMALWHSLCSRTEDVLRLKLVLAHCPAPDSTPTPQVPCPTEGLTLERVVEGGKGLLPELFGRWGVRWRQSVQDIESLYRSLGKDLVDDDSRPLENRSPTVTEELFQQVYAHLPHSLEFDSVLANMAWENILAWTKDPEDVELLNHAVDFLGKLGPGGAMVVQGVACMMWDMHLMKYVQTATYLIDKINKAPKDRLSRKEIGLSERGLRLFMFEIVRFMDVFIQANTNAEVVPAFGVEDEWKDVGNRLSLVELAVDRPMTNLGLIKLHYELLGCVEIIVAFDVKAVKPLTLFDTRGSQCMFKSLTSRPVLPSGPVDLAVEQRRAHLLHQAVEGAVRDLRDPDPSGALRYRHCVELTVRLAEAWKLDTDRVHRDHVTELYSAGLDSQAELHLSRVRETGALATELMLIVGQRLGHLCFPPGGDENLHYRTMMTSNLTTWIRSTNYRELKEPNVDLPSTNNLMSVVMRYLPENCSEYRIALHLQDFVQRIMWSSGSS